REFASVARPVDDGSVDRHLAEQVVDIAVGPLRLRQDHDLAGARGGAAHAVGVLAVAVGAADHPDHQPIERGLVGGQVVPEEEHALAGAAAHVDGRNLELLHSTLIFAALTSGHHFSMSARWRAPSACGVRWSGAGSSWPSSVMRLITAGSSRLSTSAAFSRAIASGGVPLRTNSPVQNGIS